MAECSRKGVEVEGYEALERIEPFPSSTRNYVFKLAIVDHASDRNLYEGDTSYYYGPSSSVIPWSALQISSQALTPPLSLAHP